MTGEGKADRGSGRKDDRRLGKADWAFVVAAVALIFCGHYFYGALVTDVAMVIGLGFCGLLAWALTHEPLRRGLLNAEGLAAPAILFAIVIVVGFLSLTPYLPGGPHPIWAFTGVGSPAVTIDKSSTIVEVIKLMVLACVFCVGAVTGASSRRGRAALLTLLAFGIVFGLWAFLGAATGSVQQTQGRRLEGHFLNPNTAGTLFGVSLMVGLTLLFDRRRRAAAGKVAGAVAPPAAACLLFLVCLLMSGSRGASLATLTGAVFLWLSQLLGGGKRLTRSAIIGFGVAAAAMVCVYFAGSLVAERLPELTEAGIVRSAIWADHWKAFQAAPLAGYGLGTSESVNKTLIGQGNFEVLWNIRAILNVYLQWLEQAGVVGTVPMFATIAVVIASTVRGLLRGTRARVAVLGLLAADIVFIIHGATDFGLETPSISMLWAYLLGLQLVLSQRRTAP